MAWASGWGLDGGVSTTGIPRSFTHPSFLSGLKEGGRTGAHYSLTAMGNLDDQLARVPLGALRENQGGILTGENMGKWFSKGSQELKALELKFGVKLFQRCFRTVLEFLEGESQVSVSFWWCYSTSSDLGWGPWSLPQQQHGALSEYSYELLAVSRKMHGKTEILLILPKTSEVQSNLLSFPHLQRIWRGVKFSFSPLWQNRLQKNFFFQHTKNIPLTVQVWSQI